MFWKNRFVPPSSTCKMKSINYTRKTLFHFSSKLKCINSLLFDRAVSTLTIVPGMGHLIAWRTSYLRWKRFVQPMEMRSLWCRWCINALIMLSASVEDYLIHLLHNITVDPLFFYCKYFICYWGYEVTTCPFNMSVSEGRTLIKKILHITTHHVNDPFPWVKSVSSTLSSF